VTISYEVHARREVPVSPRIDCVRADVSWEDVVLNDQKDNNYLNGMMEFSWRETK
jgi:hypothetical protein